MCRGAEVMEWPEQQRWLVGCVPDTPSTVTSFEMSKLCRKRAEVAEVEKTPKLERLCAFSRFVPLSKYSKYLQVALQLNHNLQLLVRVVGMSTRGYEWIYRKMLAVSAPLFRTGPCRTACILAAVRMTTVILQLLFVLCRLDDVLIFFVMPLLMAFISLAVQVALVWAAWDLRRTRRCFRRPQYVMHSFTLTLKLHVDLVIPLMAQRHHSELWRPAAVLVFLQLLVQVPLIS
eukprot:s239_g2.t1